MYGFTGNPDQKITKPPPLNRDYNRNADIKALKKRVFINQGTTLPFGIWDLRLRACSSSGSAATETGAIEDFSRLMWAMIQGLH